MLTEKGKIMTVIGKLKNCREYDHQISPPVCWRLIERWTITVVQHICSIEIAIVLHT